MNDEDFANGKDFATTDNNEPLEALVDRILSELIEIEAHSKDQEPIVTIDYAVAQSECVPIRVQRSRKKGSKLPTNTKCVDRTTKWGNPYKVNKHDGRYYIEDNEGNCWGSLDGYANKRTAMAKAVECYSGWIDGMVLSKKLDINELKGHNLACFCELTKPCHANILIEKANDL